MSVNLAYCLLWAGKQTGLGGIQTIKTVGQVPLLCFLKDEQREQKTHKVYS